MLSLTSIISLSTFEHSLHTVIFPRPSADLYCNTNELDLSTATEQKLHFSFVEDFLKKLNINKIDLLSNNHAKAKDLTKQGIMVENVISHQFLSSDIKNYYDSKAKKLNHDIEV